MLINDLDGDVAEEAASEIDGETAVFAGDLTKPARPGRPGQGRDRRLRPGRRRGQQRRLHLGRRRPQDVRRAVPGDARHPHDRAVPRDPRPGARPGARRPRRRPQAGEEVFRKIVNVTSISGTMGNAGQANYSSAKAGVTGLTKTIAKEWGQFKINCNAVAFGFVETRLTQAKEKGETMQAAGESDGGGLARDPRAAAPDGADDDPARASGRAFRRRGSGRVPLLGVLQLHPRPGDQRHRAASSPGCTPERTRAAAPPPGACRSVRQRPSRVAASAGALRGGPSFDLRQTRPRRRPCGALLPGQRAFAVVDDRPP